MLKKIYHDGECIGVEEVEDFVPDTDVEVDPPKELDDGEELDSEGNAE